MTLVCKIACLFALGKQALENIKEVKLRRLEIEPYQQALEYLYEQENKQGQKKMQEIMQRTKSESQ